MEQLQLQKQQSLLSPIQSTKFKSKSKTTTAATATTAAGGNKFVGVRQRPSGRWVSEIKDTTQKIRIWLGTFQTAEEAALAYDEAACLLRGTNTRTNFSSRRLSSAGESPLAARIRNLLHHKKLSGELSGELSGGEKQVSPATSESNQEVNCSPVPEYSPSSSWAFDAVFDGQSVDFEVSEFERMKVERQISASLYAINGVQEYFEAVQDLSSSSSLVSEMVDPDWDLPPLYHFY